MTDSRLRDLDRRALAGDPEARVAALRERLRSQDRPCESCRGDTRARWGTPFERATGGKISLADDGSCPSCAGTGLTLRPLVELAAYCGDEAAREALGINYCHDDRWGTGDACEQVSDGGSPPTPEHAPGTLCLDRSLAEFVSGLSRWGPLIMVRAAVAAARVALEDEWKRVQGMPWNGPGENEAWLRARLHRASAQGVIEAAEAWLHEPNEARRITLRDAHLLARGSNAPLWLPCGWAEGALALTVNWNTYAVLRAAQVAGEQPVRAGIQAALISYAMERVA